MKRKALLLSLAALLICAVVLTGCAGGGWTTVSKTHFDYNDNMDGYLNESFGVSVGFSGEIHYTNDGGATWEKAQNNSMCRFSLDIVDESLVWNGGNGSQIRISRDGGKTWDAVTDSPLGGVVSGIDFIDDKTGWICTTSALGKTSDGGSTWTKIELPEDAKKIAAIHLRTENDGYLFTRDGILYTTTDGGASWTTNDIGIASYEVCNEKGEPGLYKFNAAVADLAFTDADNGALVFCGAAPNKGMLVWFLTTSDGGASWKAELVKPEEGFSTGRVFLSEDCKYLTLGSFTKDVILMKNGK